MTKGHKAEDSLAICALTILLLFVVVTALSQPLRHDRGLHTLWDLAPIIVMHPIGAGTLETAASGAPVKQDSAALSAPSQKVRLS